MGYQRSDNHYGRNEGWRDRDREHGQSGRGYGRDDDRGFFDRAEDEVRSWFGDDEAQRRREMDERRWERERAMGGSRDSGWSSDDFAGTGGGWGNQRGESWSADRPGARSYYEQERYRSAPSGRTYGAGSGGSASRYGGSGYRESGIRGGDLHDPHYSEWRSRQINELDRDYDEYRREHQSKFEQEFGNWRGRRQNQRQSLRQVTEHMEVVGSDGEKIGIVDHVRADRIILTKNDETAGGHHHSIPCGWIERVEDKVIVDKTAQQAMDAWRDEERNRALFEREDQESEGPHILNRSFSGTY